MEVSPGALAKPAALAATSTIPAPTGNEGVEPTEPVVIVRATARLKIDPKMVFRVKDLNQEEAAWKGLQSQLFDSQRAVARAQNACIRALWMEDGRTLDEFMKEHGRPPKTRKEWVPAKLNVYSIARAVSPDISGAIASVASRTAWQKWGQVRFDSLIRQTCSPPHYRDTCPIPLRAADTKVVRDGKDYLVDFALMGGRDQRWRVRLRPRDKYQEEVLAQIASGTWKHGNVLVDRDRRNRWYFRIAYKRLVEKRVEGKVAAINRGIHTFLYSVTDDGRYWSYEGNDIVATLRQFQSRRKQYQRDSLAAGRSGRGRKRILRPLSALSGKGERWRSTKCQTIARRFVTWLVDRGVKTLLIENFEGIRDSDIDSAHVKQLIQEWPYFQLETRIRSCCEEEGIEVVKVAPHYISQRCPSCGHTGKENQDLKSWRFKCTKCGHRRHLDHVACENILGNVAS